MDTDRDQNSFIMLTKGRFIDVVDETMEVLKQFEGKVFYLIYTMYDV